MQRNHFCKAQGHLRASFRTRPNTRNSSCGVWTEEEPVRPLLLLRFLGFLVVFVLLLLVLVCIFMIIDLVLTGIFTVEMCIRIIAMGLYNPLWPDEGQYAYLCDAWNKLDFVVVISSWVNILVELTGMDIGIEVSTLRALRIMRVLVRTATLGAGTRSATASASAARTQSAAAAFYFF